MYDIAVVHGISVTQVYDSVWAVVDAANHCHNLSFSFRSSHEEQQKLAEGFKTLSDADFDTCVAATDGLLIWFERPKKEECRMANCGPK